MTISTDTVDAVAAACRDRLGDPSAWVASDAYRQSLALCIIESVQSTSGHSEVTVVDRYLAYRRAREDKPVTDGARELLRTFEEAGSRTSGQARSVRTSAATRQRVSRSRHGTSNRSPRNSDRKSVV